MQDSKIQLSHSEMELMQNAEIILTKNRVLEKMKALLEEVQQKQVDFIKENKTQNEIFTISPKISRGENYLGLPYLILDYPRQSSEQNFFFIRTMFWWGNFFSCTLHLAKGTKEEFKENIKQAYTGLKEYLIGVNIDPWMHHLEENNYGSIALLTKKEFEERCEKLDHLKIVGHYPLAEWKQASTNLYENWKFFLTTCRLIS